MRDLIRSRIGEACLLDANAAQTYTVRGQQPQVVVAPRDAEEAAAILALASENGIGVECAGAGSRLQGGNAPQKLDVVMTSARLDHVAEYEPADLVIALGAGATFPQVRSIVDPNNQFLALDPPGLPQATVGAAIATGSAGPLRFAHGTPRDQVLGLEVVTGDGRVLSFGGRVVKNVAGYDLVRLIVGSRGTLGFITRVNLRLKPRPEVDRTIALATGSFAEAADAADAILAARLDPVALEIVSESIAQDVTGNRQWTLLVRLHGNDGAVADAEQKIAQHVKSTASRALDWDCWQRLSAAESAAPLKLRLANLPSLLRDTAAQAVETASAARLQNARFAIHAGDGIVRVLADGADGDCAAALLVQRDAMERVGGTLIAERAIQNMSFDAFGPFAGLRLMSEIKRVFDPAGILGAGRFVV